MNEIPFSEDIFTPKVIKTESEYPPFQSRIAQEAFNIWLKETLGQKAKFISSDEIEKRKKGDSNTLFIPNDLKLEEIPQVLEAIPEISEERRRELQEHLVDLGKLFVNSAVYIYEYMFQHDYPATEQLRPNETEEDKQAHERAKQEEKRAQQIAIETARSLYYYGRRLTGEPIKERKGVLRDLMKSSLSDEEKIQVEQWLLGTEAYERRRKRAESLSEKKREQRRIKTTWRYFKALARTNKETESPFKELSTKTRENVRKAINQPEAALYETIFNEAFDVNRILALLQSENKPTQFNLQGWFELYRMLRKTNNKNKIEDFSIEFAKLLGQAVQNWFIEKRRDQYSSYTKNGERKPILERSSLACLEYAIILHKLLAEIGLEHEFVSYTVTENFHNNGEGHIGIIIPLPDERQESQQTYLFIDVNETKLVKIVRSTQGSSQFDSSIQQGLKVEYSADNGTKTTKVLLTKDSRSLITDLLMNIIRRTKGKESIFPYLLSIAENFPEEERFFIAKAIILRYQAEWELTSQGRLKILTQALRILDRAEQINPNNPSVFILRSEIFLEQGQEKKALEQIEGISELTIPTEQFLQLIEKYKEKKEMIFQAPLPPEEIEKLIQIIDNYESRMREYLQQESLDAIMGYKISLRQRRSIKNRESKIPSKN